MAGREIMTMKVSPDFVLEDAVCNHGFFMMAPNRWHPTTKTLERPLRLAEPELPSVTVCVRRHPINPYCLGISVDASCGVEFSYDDLESIRSQVARMLHISEEDDTAIKGFHAVHPQAKAAGFGRLFRAPTLFEDIVKSILLTHVTWGRSLDMAKYLCMCEHKLRYFKKGRKNTRTLPECDCEGMNFPTPKEIASLDRKTFTTKCKLGMRGPYIHQLAEEIESGREDLRVLGLHKAEAFNRLRIYNGIGNFVAATVVMCSGSYQYVPFDAETATHLEKAHGKIGLKCKKHTKTATAAAEEIYGRYAPYQCLAYWFERVGEYEAQLGKLSLLPEARYKDAASGAIKPILNRKRKR